MREKFKKGEIVTATRTFNGEIITGEFRGYHLFNDEIPDTVVGIVHVPGDGVYDVDVTSIRHHENKDERIRKELIEFIQWSEDRGMTRHDFHQAKRPSEWIAYLEKQKPTATINGEPIPTDNHSVDIPLAEWSEKDEKIRKELVEYHKQQFEKNRDQEVGLFHKDAIAYLEKQKQQNPIKMEVYEVGEGTTICGQDYKCKKDYKEGNCWYIKDVIYHCSRDGYLTDQNGISWSCTPKWFKEYIQSNTEWAEEEKNLFVSGQFLQCKLSFDEFKEGEHYWLEYIGDDMYVGRSDNVLNQKFHITPGQLFTLFSQKLEEVQGPPQEEKQVSLNYEPPFDENPSDKEIIEALIKHLKEQDGFLTAIGCVSTKAILNWLDKQKEQKPVEWSDSIAKEMFIKALERAVEQTKKGYELTDCDKNSWWEDFKAYSGGKKPAEWSEEDEEIFNNIIEKAKGGHWIEVNEITWLINRFKSLRPQPHLKPSKEQIEAVRYFVNKHQSEAWAATGQWKQFTALRGLLGELERLMM